MDDNTVGARIATVIRNLKIKKVRFAERLKIDQSYVTQLTSGKRNPSERLISDICREFNVNESWLRTGAGGDEAMFVQRSRDDELSSFVNELLAGESTDFRRRLVTALSRLRPEQWDALEAVALELMKNPAPAPDTASELEDVKRRLDALEQEDMAGEISPDPEEGSSASTDTEKPA